jgi:hypothetical protein
MVAEIKKEIELEIAHVLFLDIVGYSKLSVNEQHAQIKKLNEIVRLCEQYRKAEAASRLLKIPTGDGMALVFYKSPEEPAQCAVEISPRAQGQCAPASSNGHSQWTDQRCGGRDRAEKCSWGRRQHGSAGDGLRRRGAHSSLTSCG